ncbi:MAG: hypothetical protein ACM3ST_01925 [Bdellovibrio bacteriovorus]
MKLKTPILLLTLGLLTLSAGSALADWDRGWDRDWDRGWWGSDWGQHHHRHRHHSGYWQDPGPSRKWSRWDRRPAFGYRDGRRYERPLVERRTVIFTDRRR